VGNAVIKIITLAKVGNGEPLANLHVGRKKHALRGRKSHQMGDRSGGWSRPEKINEASGSVKLLLIVGAAGPAC
jgi:hypothetical protein